MKGLNDIVQENKNEDFESFYDFFRRSNVYGKPVMTSQEEARLRIIEKYINYREQNLTKNLCGEIERWVVNEFSPILEQWLEEEFVPELLSSNNIVTADPVKIPEVNLNIFR